MDSARCSIGSVAVNCIILYDSSVVNVPSIDSNNAWSPLLVAAQYGDVACVDALLRHHANIEATSNDGKRATHIAAGNGHIDVLDLLIERGASIKERDDNGWLPLHAASRYGHADTLVLLLEKEPGTVNEHIEGGFNSTALHIASEEGNIACIDVLLSYGADINERTIEGFTPLHRAADQGRTDAVNRLLNVGANALNCKNTAEVVPLHRACLHAHIYAAKALLLKAPEALESKSVGGWTSLHFAAFSDSENCLKLLLNHGADIKALTVEGETPLRLAIKHGKSKAVDFLLEQSADEVSQPARDERGRTLLHAAVEPEETPEGDDKALVLRKVCNDSLCHWPYVGVIKPLLRSQD